MKKYLVGIIGSTLLLNAAIAGSHEGIITRLHFNGSQGYTTRNLCIRMSPNIPAGGGWACLYDGNHLAKYIASQAMIAKQTKEKCSISWSTLGWDGHVSIEILDCH